MITNRLAFTLARAATSIVVAWSMFAAGHSTLAATITDNFNSSHDYSSKNVAGTIWSGVLYNDGTAATQNTTVGAANANTTTAGKLTFKTTNGSWESGIDDDGILLFRNVSGDFTATVQFDGFTNVGFNTMGIMARNSDAVSNGEDWIGAQVFNQFGVGKSIRNVNNGVSVTTPTGSNAASGWLRLERIGNNFKGYYSPDNITYTQIGALTYARADLPPMLQVGLYQATFSGNEGTVTFDNFSLDFTEVVAEPVPEPSTLVLLSLCGVGLVGYGLRKKFRRV